MNAGVKSHSSSGAGRLAEWDTLRDWLGSPPLWHKVDLEVLRERLVFMGRARSSLVALPHEPRPARRLAGQRLADPPRRDRPPLQVDRQLGSALEIGAVALLRVAVHAFGEGGQPRNDRRFRSAQSVAAGLSSR